MRVVLDLRAAHPGLTGIGRYAVNLCLSLERIGGPLEVELITTAAGAEYLRGHIRSRVSIVRGDNPDWDDLVLPDLVSRLRADVFHTPLFTLPKILACASVCTVHDVIPLARPDLSSPAFSQFFNRHIGRALRQANHIVTVSEFSKKDIVRFFPEDSGRVTAIHEPVSPLFQRHSPAQCEETLTKHALSPGFFLYVGALDRRKNISCLLDAYQALRGRISGLPLLVIAGGASGDGYNLDGELSRRGLTKQVRRLGRVSDVEVVHLYSSAFAFVFPSLYEGFGLPVVEAMSTGTPVIASNSTSLPEVAGDAALLVDPNDPSQLSDAMARVYKDEAYRSSLAAKGLVRSREFSLENQGERLMSLYRRLCRMAA